MNVGHVKLHQAVSIPDGSLFVRGTRDIRPKSGEEVVESFYGLRLPAYSMAYHVFRDGYCWSRGVLWFFGRSGFRFAWVPVPGAEWVTEIS